MKFFEANLTERVLITGGVPNKNQKTLFGKCSYWAFLFLLGAPAKKLFLK